MIISQRWISSSHKPSQNRRAATRIRVFDLRTTIGVHCINLRCCSDFQGETFSTVWYCGRSCKQLFEWNLNSTWNVPVLIFEKGTQIQFIDTMRFFFSHRKVFQRFWSLKTFFLSFSTNPWHHLSNIWQWKTFSCFLKVALQKFQRSLKSN